MCYKIKATASIEYDVEDVLADLRHDYPNEVWEISDAKDMIHKWIKDDFENMIVQPKIEEINA